LSDTQRVSIFLSAVQPAVDKYFENFVALLTTNDRVLLLPQIAEQFEALKDKAEGVAQANITSAFPMSEDQISQLIALLEPKFGLKLKPHVTVDAALIGGVRVHVGDQVLDTSVQAQLVRMRDTLAA
jgi:F-type H+-transporting ATPase subunit delta